MSLWTRTGHLNLSHMQKNLDKIGRRCNDKKQSSYRCPYFVIDVPVTKG